jgi:hypothetical protein
VASRGEHAAPHADRPPPATPSNHGGEVQLRVYLLVESLQRQFAAYMGSPLRARGYPPLEGVHALIVEVSPGIAIERVTDLALRAVPAVEPGILYVERQFGVLQIHSAEIDDVKAAGRAILGGIDSVPKDQLRPKILFADVIEDLTDRHAIIVNRTRQASMVLPGESLLIVEMAPALFAAVVANEAERAVPDNTLVDVQMIGAAGRVYVSGTTAGVEKARDVIVAVLGSIEGRSEP